MEENIVEYTVSVQNLGFGLVKACEEKIMSYFALLCYHISPDRREDY